MVTLLMTLTIAIGCFSLTMAEAQLLPESTKLSCEQFLTGLANRTLTEHDTELEAARDLRFGDTTPLNRLQPLTISFSSKIIYRTLLEELANRGISSSEEVRQFLLNVSSTLGQSDLPELAAATVHRLVAKYAPTIVNLQSPENMKRLRNQAIELGIPSSELLKYLEAMRSEVPLEHLHLKVSLLQEIQERPNLVIRETLHQRTVSERVLKARNKIRFKAVTNEEFEAALKKSGDLEVRLTDRYLNHDFKDMSSSDMKSYLALASELLTSYADALEPERLMTLIKRIHSDAVKVFICAFECGSRNSLKPRLQFFLEVNNWAKNRLDLSESQRKILQGLK